MQCLSVCLSVFPRTQREKESAGLPNLPSSGKLIDVYLYVCLSVFPRTQREKESAGLPDLPNSGKLIDVEFATIEDKRLRSQLRNVSAIELEVYA
jgi:hypothetical protein